MTAWKHDELALDLAGYLSGPDLMVWTDMQLGPSGSPRPDVYTLRKSYSKPKPMAFECKISRSDLRSDTTSGKWQSYLKFAGGVVFAVPDGLCTVADIPQQCGLIVRKAKEWRFARRPTLQRAEPPFSACMKLLIDGVNRTYKTPEPRPRSAAVWRDNEAVRKRYGAAVASAARDLHAVEQRVATLKETADAAWERTQEDIRARAEMLKSQFARDEAEWAAVRNEVFEWLSIENGSVYQVRRKIEELKAACAADSRVADADSKLEQARAAIESALRCLPERVPHTLRPVA